MRYEHEGIEYEPVPVGEIIPEGSFWFDSRNGGIMLYTDIDFNAGQAAESWQQQTGYSRICRPINIDRWVSTDERLPEHGKTVSVVYRDGRVGGAYSEYVNAAQYSHWRAITPPPAAKPKPVTIFIRGMHDLGTYTVIPQKDGSLKIGCVTVTNEQFEEITRQRNEAMK